MPVPLNKSTYTKYPYAGLGSLNMIERNQFGVNNQLLAGKVVSQYTAQYGLATSVMWRISGGSAFGYPCLAQIGSGLFDSNRYGFAQARNRAYSSFRDEAFSSQSALGSTIAEWKQSLNMVTTSALTARDAWRRFRRGQYSRMVDTVINPGRRNPPRRQTQSVVERASAAWLAFWFGVAPTYGDIYDACQQISEPIPSNLNYEGRARRLIYERTGTLQKVELDGLFKVRTGAKLRLSNPNLYLLNQLGLLNPLSVAWEVTPFSFLLDWAFDIGSFLEAMTDFVGVEVTLPYTNEKIMGTSVTYRPDVYTGKWVSHQVQFRRYNGLLRPMPNAEVRANLGHSITRAASAVSLLIQATASVRR